MSNASPHPRPLSGERPAGAARDDREPPALVGVSACLLGETVRYDGGHKRTAVVVDVLSRIFRLVPVCPEVGIGLGTPRETLHLVHVDGEVRLRTTETALDHTDAMERYAHRKLDELHSAGVCGFVLKRASPSCGVGSARQIDADGRMSTDGTGAFARVLLARLPHLPVVDEQPLEDPELREAFIERVLAYRRQADGQPLP